MNARVTITITLIGFLILVGFAIARAGDNPDRVVGHGQIRFNGLGPERWAQRWRLEHRTTQALKRRLRAMRRTLPPTSRLVADFLCVYDGENAGHGWSANTGNGYYGGLQMDLDFQRTWGLDFFREWGTADHWPAQVQLAVAIRAYLHRGWQPWPNTSRACGLQ